MNILFSNESAHADISGSSGKGKTFLAKQIIANHPHITNVFVFSRNHQDWSNPKDNLEDIQNTWNLYERINKKKLVQECIVVFDDFNNESSINMWSNKTIKQMFTEGRKYGVYCILIHHSNKDSGNIAIANCYYKVLFPKGDAQELHLLSNLSLVLNPEDVKAKYLDTMKNTNLRAYLLLKGNSDLQMVIPTSKLPSNEVYALNHKVLVEPQNTGNTGINSNVQNNGQVVNSTINMQTNSVHNHLIQTNTINQNIEIQNIYHQEKINKINMALRIKAIVRQHFISADDRDILIFNLNAYNNKGAKITFNNYKRASVAFCKINWKEEAFNEPEDSMRDTLNIGRQVINGDSEGIMNTLYNSYQPSIQGITNHPSFKKNTHIKAITDSLTGFFR